MKVKSFKCFLNCACRQVSLLPDRNEVSIISIKQWSMIRLLFLWRKVLSTLVIQLDVDFMKV